MGINDNTLTRLLSPLQEVTPIILDIWRRSAWWQRYEASPHIDAPYFTLLLVRKDGVKVHGPFMERAFKNSIMGESAIDM